MNIKRKRIICSILVTVVFSLLLSACGVDDRSNQENPGSPIDDIRQQGRENPLPKVDSTGQPKDNKNDDDSREEVQKPKLPETLGAEENKEPSLKVYITQESQVKDMKFEEYVAGVVAGEIKNDWPVEAIKAQAIIARTFVLQFIEEKGQSKYEDAHVSTDIEEAQAWNAGEVNDTIRQAVEDTRGQVIVYDGQFARTWFHSNAGGKTATPKEGLNYKDEEPPYIQVVESPDTGEAVEADAKNWTAKFSKDTIMAAMDKAGKPINGFNSITIGEQGPSGRALTIKVDDTEISAAELRLAVGTTDMRSTLIDKIALEGNNVVMTGRGYGHGVGMSQWGAYNMAKDKKGAEDIINHYFKDIDVVKMWD